MYWISFVLLKRWLFVCFRFYDINDLFIVTNAYYLINNQYTYMYTTFDVLYLDYPNICLSSQTFYDIN